MIANENSYICKACLVRINLRVKTTSPSATLYLLHNEPSVSLLFEGDNPLQKNHARLLLNNAHLTLKKKKLFLTLSLKVLRSKLALRT